MKQKKRTIAPQEMWDPAAIERWLEEEARQGWRITDCNGWFAKFERAEPRECRVRVYPCGPESKEAWKERIAVYEEMGWHFAVALQMDFEVYYCDDPAIPELDTDPAVFAMAWREPLRRSWRNAWLLLAAMLALMALMPMLFGGTLLEYLLEAQFRILYATLLMAPVFAVMAVQQLWRVHQARKKLEAGVRHTSGENWRRSRSRWRIVAIMVLVFWFGAWMADIFWITQEPDTTGLPYVSKTELLPDTSVEDWEVDLHRYVRTTSPLRPVRSEEGFWYQGEYGVINARSRLRFEFLAEALYREKLEQFRAEQPEAEETAVENDAFDEAVLLSDGDVQILLVRAEKIVYSLWVNFPADLSAGIESAAECLSA